MLLIPFMLALILLLVLAVADLAGTLSSLLLFFMRFSVPYLPRQLVSREVLDLKNRLGLDLENPVVSVDPEKVTRYDPVAR